MKLSIPMPLLMVLVWEVLNFFLKSRVTGVTQAKSNIGHLSFFTYKVVLDLKNRPNTGHLNGV
jgi:hypothetical protein